MGLEFIAAIFAWNWLPSKADGEDCVAGAALKED